MSDKELKKGTVVYSQGDPGDCMYFIRWGKVGLFTGYKTLGQKKVAELMQGDYFGEMGLIDGEQRPVTAVVTERDTQIDCITRENFGQFLLNNPNKVYQIIQQLCHTLRQTTNDYLSVCQSVSDAVGGNASDVDATSNYRFEQDDQLREIHDQQAAEPSINA
ncbi:MAG: cyclic nucleotide-binding domain-containing protein [Atopobiaceae bacterium]|nr:cyclic nucleotide-binding domain-containing protein [Atopobiaceae bacterium]